MTFYTPLERLAKTAKEGGFQKVSADVDVVAQLIEIAQAAEVALMALNKSVLALAHVSQRQSVYTPDYKAAEKGITALRAALGTQPVKETNHG